MPATVIQNASPCTEGAMETLAERRLFDGFFDRFFPSTHEAIALQIGSEEQARLLTSEALARVVEHPLWRLSLRHGLPLEPLVLHSVQEVIGEYDAGWRPAVA